MISLDQLLRGRDPDNTEPDDGSFTSGTAGGDCLEGIFHVPGHEEA